MCDIFDKIFGVDRSGEDRLTQLLGQQQKSATDAAGLATGAAKFAVDRATTAAMPEPDSEAARLAAERRMRRLLGVDAGFGAPSMGAAPIGYRALTGQ